LAKRALCALAWPESSLRWSAPKTAPLPVQAQALGQNVKALFEQHGLLGYFAVDCAKPPNEQNRYAIYRALDGNRVQRDMIPQTSDSTLLIDRATESKPNELSLGRTSDLHGRKSSRRDLRQALRASAPRVKIRAPRGPTLLQKRSSQAFCGLRKHRLDTSVRPDCVAEHVRFDL
jgi:hypothetical protein